MVFPKDMVCLRNTSVNTLHKGDTDDDDNSNNNAIRSTILQSPGQIKYFPSTEAQNISSSHLYNTVHNRSVPAGNKHVLSTAQKEQGRRVVEH